MGVQGRLVEALFSEIHQVFAKKLGTFLTDLVYIGSIRSGSMVTPISYNAESVPDM